MTRSLVIVESPAKARTINRYLGRNYVVKASMGHVRDLPKTVLGIDIDQGFAPRYRNIPDKRKVLAELAGAAKKADLVFLAPDPDREGEAIAWHLVQALHLPEEKVRRVTFNEITKRAVADAFLQPGKIHQERVDAQQARRILDRLMGYLLSPLLWEKVSRGLSAGRVQSVAVRLLVEREREIAAFVSQEFWRIAADLATPRGERFTAQLLRVDGEKAKVPDEAQARALVARIEGASPVVAAVARKPKTESPPPPFITSTLQQVASTRLRFNARRTMRLAQDMYEGVEIGGESVALITYMRTDSFRVAEEAIQAVRALIGERYGAETLPPKPNRYRARKGAQEAHEAIRPTEVERTPQSLAPHARPAGRRGQGFSTDHLRLYQLIWERFVASQMVPARYELTVADVDAAGCTLQAEGKRLLVEGFLKVAGRDPEEVLLPAMAEGEALALLGVAPSQHFTQPPPRYTEATLVRALEKNGIGRPSTYAAILSTITDRGYAEIRERKFHATDLGALVTDLLVQHFGDLVNVDFTSTMEGRLDLVEEGKAPWSAVVDDFYRAFAADLERAKEGMRDFRRNPEVTDQACATCGAPLVVRRTRRGTFLGCSKYPECTFTRPLDRPDEPEGAGQATAHDCARCGKKLVLRSGRNGLFLGCSGYPECRYTVPVDEEGNPAPPPPSAESCEKCGAPMVVKKGRRGPFLACSAYPECQSTKPVGGRKRPEPRETHFKCGSCGAPMMLRHGRWGPFLGCSAYPKCKTIQKVNAAMRAELGLEETRKPAGDGKE